MGQLGVHFAIDAATAQRLLAAADDDELCALVEEIEEELLDVDSCGTDRPGTPSTAASPTAGSGTPTAHTR